MSRIMRLSVCDELHGSVMMYVMEWKVWVRVGRLRLPRNLAGDLSIDGPQAQRIPGDHHRMRRCIDLRL